MSTNRVCAAAAGCLLVWLAASPVAAQASLQVGAHGVALLTHATPMLHGDGRTEAYLTQPTLLGNVGVWDGRLGVRATVSLEPLTLGRGELGPGTYGEGYVDRRHPHTYAHELIVMARGEAGRVSGSLAAGRGFAPFGTDDPMMRPFVKFPVNHHLGQILERLVAVAAVRVGPVLGEAGVFNGDEPSDPTDLGTPDRFGDSWSARLTLLPLAGVEVQASRAWVVSPELPTGDGLDQRKWSASIRYDAARAIGHVYALAEWKRTTEVSDGNDIFGFGSVLLESSLEWKKWRPALRVERSERPEEPRLFDPFRTAWPHADTHLLGITRWTIVAARLERAVTVGALRLAPFLEGSVADVRLREDAPFEPEQFYGDTRITTLNIGVRAAAGWHPPRMGRYGVAAAVAPSGQHH